MANTLTNLAADLYVRHDRVMRELCGFIPSVTINAGAERAAYNDTVRSFATRAVTVGTSYSPSMTIPEGTDQTVDNLSMTLDSFANVQIPWTGEDVKHLNNGAGFEAVRQDQVSQAIRALMNKIELAIALKAKAGSSRAYGTAGTTPFASDISALPQIRKILADNGAPMDDGQWSLVMDTTAGANLRSIPQLQKVNESGEANMLRQGTLSNLVGFMLKESAQISLHTKGTGSGYLLNDATPAIGDTTITADTGTGTVLGGDIVTFAGTTDQKYVVNTALSGGSFTIGSPGMQDAETDNDAITVGNSYTPNIALHRSAIELAIRPPAQPPAEAAVDTMLVTDPLTGVTIELALYGGYQKAMLEARCFYAVKVWKPDMVATLLG
jgi:hypothetical protein